MSCIRRCAWMACLVLVPVLTAGCGGGDDASGDAGTSTVDSTLDTADANGTDTASADAANEDGAADAEPDTEPDASIDLAQTPAGQQLVWLVGVINNWQTKQLSAADYEAHFADEYRAKVQLAVFQAKFLKGTLQKYGPLTIEGWEPGYGGFPIAHLRGALKNHWMRWAVLVEPDLPHRITSIRLGWALDLDPDWVPVGGDELGVFAVNPSANLPVQGLDVQVLDRTTGLPLEPPVVGKVSEKYHYVRLKIPAGHPEVGVRVVQSDGQVTDTYSPDFRPGVDYQNALAAEKPLWPLAAKAAAVAIEPGRAHVWGVVGYAPEEKSITYTFDAGVGCASATSPTTTAPIFYGAPPNGLPDKTATQTTTESSNWFAFNLDPVPTSFSTQAKGPPVVVELVPLAADALTVVFVRFHEATYPTNPSPGPCAK